MTVFEIKIRRSSIRFGKLALQEMNGYFDGYWGLAYDDGNLPAHRFQICIPNDEDPYRCGYLAGMIARAEHAS